MYVYSGKTDLTFTCLFLPALICAGVDWSWSANVVMAWRILAGILLTLSVVGAWRANRCRWWAVLALPIKHLLTASLVICALLTVGGAMALANGRGKNNRTGNVATAASAAFGFAIVWHWIKRLTRPNPDHHATANSEKHTAAERRFA